MALGQKIKTFSNSLLKSLTSPSYYSDVIKAPFSFSVKYFVALAILSSIILTLITTFQVAPKMRNDINNFLKQVVAQYPANLVLTMKSAKLSINQTTPYIVPFPKDLQQDKQTKQFKNLLVIAPNGTVGDLDKYKTMILVNSSNVLVKNQEEKLETYSLKQFPDGSFSKATLLQYLQKLQPMITLVVVVVSVAIFLFILLYNLVFRSIYLVIPAFIFWGVAKARSFELTFKQAVQIAAHAITLPILAECVFEAINFQIPLPLWYFFVHVIFGVVIIVVLSQNSKVHTTSNSAPTSANQ
ncbi:MAG TPA: DUF1189 family protein [Candidatus Saccharimonadales bacterium]|nr:DUF1189 family protein [Candidatus Saccharimonadales bacterium]